MAVFRANIVGVNNEFEAHIWVNRGWISTNPAWLMYQSKRAAKKRAERVADALGISLKWEEDK